MAEVNIYNLVFPVCSGEDLHMNGKLSTVITQIAGTAFSIGNGMFLTAAHVIEQTSQNTRRIVREEEGNLVGFLPSDVEVIEGLDLAVMCAPDLTVENTIPWTTEAQARLSQVFSPGYPFAFDNENLSVNARAFMGYVAGINHFMKLENQPEIYELAFDCPRGLSGAPVVIWGKQPQICGVVIGNKSTEMNVFTEREEVTEGNTTIVERYEAMHLGVALSAGAVLNASFDILNGTVEEHLSGQGLIV